MTLSFSNLPKISVYIQMEIFQFTIAVHISYLLIIICLAEVKCKSMYFPLHKDDKGAFNGLKRFVLEKTCV